MKKPLLSIIIVTWNTAKITHQSVETIKRHLTHLNYQLIVVDNGSTDETPALFSTRRDLIYHRNPANFGFSKANNIGVRLATGRYLLFLNSDIELIDSSLLAMLRYLSLHPRVGLIGPQMLNVDLTPQASVFPAQTLNNAYRFAFLKQKTFLKYQPKGLNPIAVFAVSGGALLVRKSVFKKLGTWNENYYFYFEDLDLCRQAHRLGYQVIFYPRSRVVHHHGASGSSLSSASNQWRRLINGSIIYHGRLKHLLLTLILWLGQKIKP